MRREDQSSGVGVQGSEGGNRKPGLRAGWILALAAAVLAGCAAPKAQFTDADWVSHSSTGRGAYERGDFRRAADAYGRAQQRARALDDADALAVAAVNRATCLVAAGQPREARAAVDEALADLRVSAGRRTELLAAGARADAALGRADDVRMRAEQVLATEASPALRAQAALALAGAELDRGEKGKALQALSDGLSAKEWSRLPASLRAEERELNAGIATADGRAREAAAALDEAAAQWKEAGRLPEMARALAKAGRQAQAAGDLAGACDRFWRSARSLWAQGLPAEAAGILEEGVGCAEQLGDEQVAKRMAELLVTFTKEHRP